ncbi:MAG: pyrroline-5-carboxylate reductase [Chitinophagales bacterium]|nr:pyrroline-5-carboxylate reductase [Chitinophagales bacterium]
MSQNFKKKKIAIIGGGNLGISITEGLIKTGLIESKNITVTRRKVHLIESRLQKLINVTSDNVKAVSGADIVLLAIKPKQLMDVLKEIQPVLNAKKHLVISVVTGISIPEITKVIATNVPLFRAMPNTAIAIQQSMTCVSTKNGTEQQKELVMALFEKLGKAVFIEDELMSAATVLAACGIAYSLRYIRAASQGGIEIGFDAATAQLIAAQTVKGAASLLLERGEHPEKEIDRVTTPQGCTIAGINEMEHQGFSSSLIKGIITSYKSIENIK